MPMNAPTCTRRPSASIGRVTARSSRSASCSGVGMLVPRCGKRDRKLVAGKPRDQIFPARQLLQ